MSNGSPIPLKATVVELRSPEFAEVAAWPYRDEFVLRLLLNDIPQRYVFNECQIWMYRDPGGRLAGFGTLDVCDDYRDHSAGRPHTYIPLLAVNPAMEGQGHGTSIVNHLVELAAIRVLAGDCHDVLFLDVYATSVPAIGLYRKRHFVTLNDEPIPDAAAGGKPYYIMARRLSIATA